MVFCYAKPFRRFMELIKEIKPAVNGNNLLIMRVDFGLAMGIIITMAMKSLYLNVVQIISKPW